jgi:hypothetical protein
LAVLEPLRLRWFVVVGVDALLLLLEMGLLFSPEALSESFEGDSYPLSVFIIKCSLEGVVPIILRRAIALGTDSSDSDTDGDSAPVPGILDLTDCWPSTDMAEDGLFLLLLAADALSGDTCDDM